MRAAGRDVWLKIRASAAERAEWHAKACSAGLTLSDLVRRSVGRVRTWTVAHAEVERERFLLAEKLQTRSILTLHLVSFQGVRSEALAHAP